MSPFAAPSRLLGLGPSAIRELFDRAPPGSVNLGLGEPDLEPPEAVKRAAVRAVERERNGYTPQAGLVALRELVAADTPSLGGDAGRVVVTAGAQEALFVALMSLVDADDEVLLPDPGFVAYATIVRLAGGQPVFYPLLPERDFAFDAGAFSRAVTPRTKVAVLNSPSNPTGRVLDTADLVAIVGALDAVGAYVVSDEIYRDLHFGDARPPSISDLYPKTLVVGGLSKSLAMTGWRIGWLASPPEVAPGALALHAAITTCASAISQKGALAAWSPEGRDAVAYARAAYRARRDLLRMRLAGLGVESVEPDGAFYVMAETRAYGSSVGVAEAALARGVITVPGSAFGSRGEGYTRLSCAAGRAEIEEGVRRFGCALASLERRHVASFSG